MERNNKTLLIAVLIMLLALVSLNFNNISGRAAGRGTTDVRVSPTTINAPGTLNVVVDTDVAIDARAYLYEYPSGHRVGFASDQLCQGSICDPGIIRATFYVSDAVNLGRYTVGVAQRGSGGELSHSNVFTVR